MATDGATFNTNERLEDRMCTRKTIPSFVKELFSLLGVQPSALQHYAWLRQRSGLPTFVDRLTWDCSSTPYRHFWHATKLRSEFHARLPGPPPQRSLVVIVDRTGRRANPAWRLAVSETRWRTVTHQAEIVHHVQQTLQRLPGGFRAARFTGEGIRIVDQAMLFRSVAAVVGPHGAAESNYIFCQPGTPVVEYVRSCLSCRPPLPQSALYPGYAHAFDLPYWAVVSNSSDGSYDGIYPEDVANTVKTALVVSYASASALSEPERLARRAAHQADAEWDTFVTHAYESDGEEQELGNANKVDGGDWIRLHGWLH
eukprot:1217978-Prymnesium_polylepis.1